MSTFIERWLNGFIREWIDYVQGTTVPGEEK